MKIGRKRQNAIPPQRIVKVVAAFIAAIILKAVEVTSFTLMSTHLISSSKTLSSKQICLDTDIMANNVGERIREYEETFRYPPRNSVFDTTNVISKTVEIPQRDPFLLAIIPKSSMWSRLTEGSQTMTKGKIGCDVTVEFQNAAQGAVDLVDKCLIQSKISLGQSSTIVAQSYIKSALEFFQQYACSTSREESYSFKARIVSSIGNVGQKCPRFHVDHIPLRLVLSLKGPGPVYIPFENEIGVDRKSLNELNDLDTERANSMIIPFGEKGYAEYAGEGDAMLFMGKAWEGEGGISSIPHRSPRLKDNEERILLVCDILPKQEE